jgi:hypothetical protein
VEQCSLGLVSVVNEEAASIGLETRAGGVLLPFVGIKLIDLVVHNLLGA